MDPDTLTLQDRQKLLALLPATSARALDYLAGRQLGPKPGSAAYWSGPMLPPSHPRYGEMQEALLKGFSARNMVLEVCERLADAATADEPGWGLTPARALKEGETPTADEQARIDELEAALTEWWDREDMPGKLQAVAAEMIALGRSPARFVVPPQHLRDGVLARADNPSQALTRLRLLQAPALTSGIITDPETLDPIAVTAYQVTDSAGRVRQEMELSYARAGQTVLRILRDGEDAQEVTLPLGGHLWLTEARAGRPLVTEDMLSQQDALNVALTMLSRNTHFAGFVERYGIGIEPPRDAEGNPAPLNIGPGTANFFQPSAFEETRMDGLSTTTSYRPASASYGRFEPSRPDAITAAIAQAESNVYAIARQRFVQMADSATASGRSREVAAGDYLTAAGRTARSLEAWLRDVLEFAVHFAAVTTGQPERYAGLRVSVTCRVRAFSPAPEDRAADLQAVQAGLMSRETAQTRLGLPDPAAEQQRIESEQAGAEGLGQAQGGVNDGQNQQNAVAGFATGDRVTVKAGSEHHMGGMSMGGSGVVEIVSTPALGIRLDDMPDEVHKWYVAAELTPEGGSV